MRHPVETLWREVGLPEYFLGNHGTNHKLYELYDRICSGAGAVEWMPIATKPPFAPCEERGIYTDDGDGLFYFKATHWRRIAATAEVLRGPVGASDAK